MLVNSYLFYPQFTTIINLSFTFKQRHLPRYNTPALYFLVSMVEGLMDTMLECLLVAMFESLLDTMFESLLDTMFESLLDTMLQRCIQLE